MRTPTAELLDRHYPKVERRKSFSGNEVVLSNEKAKRVLGPDGSEPSEEAGLVSELLDLKPFSDGPEISRRDIASVLDFLASVQEGRPIASAQGNVQALVHTFLEPDRRRRYARLARYALASCKRQDVLGDSGELPQLRPVSTRPAANSPPGHPVPRRTT